VKPAEILALSDSGADEDMTENQKSRGQSWFERHPKKTLLLTLLILLVGATYAAEKILAHLNHSHNLVLFTDRRYINLREFLPSIDVVEVPQTKTVQESDGLVQKEYRVRTDANGFILPYHQDGRPDLTLVFLGGSTTACIFVEEENRFPYLVGNLLEQMTGKKITSINGGVSGSNTLNSIDVLLNKVIPLKPDAVVMMHNINDLICLAYDKTYWSRNPSRGPIVEFTFYKNLRGWRALTTMVRDLYIPNLHVATRVLSKKIFGKVEEADDEFAQVRGKKVELHQAQLIEEFTLNLQTFINICRARKITPVLMTQCSRVKANPDEKVRLALQRFAADTKIPLAAFLDIYGRFNQAIVEVGRANHILVIDLAREIPQEKRYLYDVVHLNAAGSRLAARVISEKLKAVVAP
jgi:lysophospholipase L1-like esterase